MRVLSAFFGKNRGKNGCFTLQVVISTLRRKIFLGVCGKFLRNIGSFFADVEQLNVKVNLFFEQQI